ncbi:glycosyltransferase [Candidatus Kaiserbacteria bacterium]|nr:glycosyltransferase [Candidatus Kaiserbacteria bacterium]
MGWLPSRLPFTPRERWVLSIALVLVVVVNIASHLYFLSLSAASTQPLRYPIVPGDSFYYAHVADIMLTHGVHGDALPNFRLTNGTVPGYPFLVAASQYLTGSYLPLIVLQLVLALVAVVLIFAIGRRVVPWQLALFASLCYALEPMVVFTTSTIMTDSLFTSLLILVIYGAFMQRRFVGTSRSVFLGLSLGLLSMLRPTGIMLAPIVIAFYVARVWMDGGVRRTHLAAIALFITIVGTAIPTVPWIARNYVQLGRAELFRSGVHAFSDYNLRYFLAWRELGKEGAESVFYPARHLTDPVFTSVDARIKEAWVAATPSGEDPELHLRGVVRDFILADPLRYAYFHLSHLVVFFLSSDIGLYRQSMQLYGDSDAAKNRSTMYETLAAIRDLGHPEKLLAVLPHVLPIVIEVAWWLVVCGFALVGLYAERKRLEVWLYATMILYFGVAAGAVTVARYRISAEPFLLLLAAYGVYAVGWRMLGAYRAGSSADATVEGWSRLTELVRYLVAGGSSLVVSVGLYAVLVYAFGMWYVTASVVSFIAGFIVSFVLQKFFAFRDQQGPGQGEQVGAYLALLVFNVAANAAMLSFFVGYIGMDRMLGLLWANFLVAVWNFFIYEKLIFTDRELVREPIAHAVNGSLANLSIVIPCFNEAESIGMVLDAIPAGVGEVIVVDNNSTDNTARIARERGAIVITERMQGTGAAMRTGFHRASKSVIAVIDGDNQHPAGELPRILDKLESGYDFVSAARFPLSDSWLRGFGNWGLTFLVNILFGLKLTDSQSGMVVFRRALVPVITPESHSFVFVQELKIRAAIACGARFAEVRIPCVARAAGVSKLLPLRHGTKLLWELLRLRTQRRR